LYRRRALVESVFSAVKRKLSTRAPGRSLEMQRIQALLLGLAYNLYRLKPCSV
jgi:Transposase DDE domain